MCSFQDNVGTWAGNERSGRGAELQTELDARLLRFCCGNRIAPQLVEIRRPEEGILFITVWPCPKCRKVTR